MNKSTRFGVIAASLLAISATSAFAQAESDAGKMRAGGFAVVSSNGKEQNSSGVKQVTHVSTGVYKVQFNADVSNCSGVASITGSAGSATPASIVVSNANSQRNSNGDSVGVETFNNTTMIATDEPFNLTVTCAKSK